MASLLFGFDSDRVSTPAPSANSMSPLDSSLAVSFEPHIPVPFRPQYTKAVQTLMTRYSKAANQPATTSASSITATLQTRTPVSSVKHEPSSASCLPLKREYGSLSASQEAQLPPPTTQQEFVARVKAKLDQSSYAVFKSVILSLESAPTPPQPQPIPPSLLLLFQRLQKVLDSLPLLRAYAALIPQRLRPTFQQYLASRDAAAALKWTGAVDVDAQEEAEPSPNAPAAKRPKVGSGDPRVPIYAHKTVVQPQL